MKNFVEANDLKFSYPLIGINKKLYSNGIVGSKIDGKANQSKSVSVLNGLNFKFYPGDRVGLSGNNGAGKTTLLRLLGRIYEPTSGSIRVDGKVGIFLDVVSGFDFEATGIENIKMRGLLLGFSLDYISNKLESIVKFSEIGDFVHLPVKVYSAGMLARLSFAIVNLADPDIYLIDETIGTGDINFQKKISKKFKQIVSSDKIIICASHSKELLNTICNMGIFLEDGKINKTFQTNKKNEIF